MPSCLLRLSLLVAFALVYARICDPGTSTALAADPCPKGQVAFSGPGDAVTERSVTAIACATSRIRSLMPRSPVPVRFLAAGALGTAIAGTAQVELAGQSVPGTAGALHLLGALGSEQDLTAASRRPYPMASAADYDPRTRCLYVLAAKKPFSPLDRAVIAHEYTKALQDQSFGLSRLLTNTMSAGGYDTDALMAREAVVEGDAFITMLNYAASFSKQDQVTFNQQLQSSGSTTSDFAQDRLGFPTQQGTVFVKYLMAAAAKGRKGDAANAAAIDAVNHALADPPSSTRQVLNPALYLQSTRASASLAAPSVSLGTGWQRTSSDVLGSFTLIDLLDQHQTSAADTQAATLASTTLQSDRWAMYQSSGNSLLIWRTHFDSTAGAQAFVKAFLSYTGARFHATLASAAPVDWHSADYAMSLRQNGSDVALAVGSSSALQTLCRQAVAQQGLH